MAPDLTKVFLYRITHIENIPHIHQYGITHTSSPNANSLYVSIGDENLISKRSNVKLPNHKKVGDYIPFYFGSRMPMLYVIQKGFNNVPPTSPENIVYCVTSVQEIISQKLDFVFTDGHAFDSFSSFYQSNEIGNIENIIDRKAINSQYWIDENDLDKKRRKEAEFLVLGDIQRVAIIGFIVYNEEAKLKLLSFGIDNKQVHLKSKYYF